MIDFPKILALDVAGNPHKWITYDRASYYYCKDLIAWQMGSDGYQLHGGIASITGKQSTLDINSIIAIKGSLVTRMRNHGVPPLNNRPLFYRDDRTCAYCGMKFVEADLTRDHVIPVSHGGPNKWDNVVTCCSPCNKHKNDRTPTQAKMPLLFEPYLPNRSEYLILTNRALLPDQYDFLIDRVGIDSRLRKKSVTK